MDIEQIADELFKQVVGHLERCLAPLIERVAAIEARQPERGMPGKDGEPGRDAEPIDVQDVVRELLATSEIKTMAELHAVAAVHEYMAEHPVRDGKDGEPGREGQPGKKGDPGRDGVGMAGAVIDRNGALVITQSDGKTVELGVVIGKDGKDGEPGKDGSDGVDGLGFDDLDAAFDPDQGVTLKFTQGERQKTFRWSIPVMKHVGFWRESMSAKAGNTTTHNGSLWIALRDTKATPNHENADDWMLAARKGRDGDPGKVVKEEPVRPVKLEAGRG